MCRLTLRKAIFPHPTFLPFHSENVNCRSLCAQIVAGSPAVTEIMLLSSEGQSFLPGGPWGAQLLLPKLDPFLTQLHLLCLRALSWYSFISKQASLSRKEKLCSSCFSETITFHENRVYVKLAHFFLPLGNRFIRCKWYRTFLRDTLQKAVIRGRFCVPAPLPARVHFMCQLG